MNRKQETDPGKGKFPGRILVAATGVVAVLMMLGMLSSAISRPGTVSDTKTYLESAYAPEPGGAAGRPCWVEPGELTEARLPDHFAEGPDWRAESNLDLLFFRPGFVLRPTTGESCRESGSNARTWGYVRARSPVPFFVRTHFGYFPEPGEVATGTHEGVRTYFSFFGKTMLLNEWSTGRESE